MQSPVWETEGFPVPGMSGRYLKFHFYFYCNSFSRPTLYKYFRLVQLFPWIRHLYSTFKEKSTKGVDLSKEEPSLEDEQGGIVEDEQGGTVEDEQGGTVEDGQGATVEDGQGATPSPTTGYSEKSTAFEENTTYDGN